MARKRYRSALPRDGRVKADFIPCSEYEDTTFYPQLTIECREPSTIRTGILDADGHEIVYDDPGMDPIGFVHFAWQTGEEEIEDEEDYE